MAIGNVYRSHYGKPNVETAGVGLVDFNAATRAGIGVAMSIRESNARTGAQIVQTQSQLALLPSRIKEGTAKATSAQVDADIALATQDSKIAEAEARKAKAELESSEAYAANELLKLDATTLATKQEMKETQDEIYYSEFYRNNNLSVVENSMQMNKGIESWLDEVEPQIEGLRGSTDQAHINLVKEYDHARMTNANAALTDSRFKAMTTEEQAKGDGGATDPVLARENATATKNDPSSTHDEVVATEHVASMAERRQAANVKKQQRSVNQQAWSSAMNLAGGNEAQAQVYFQGELDVIEAKKVAAAAGLEVEVFELEGNAIEAKVTVMIDEHLRGVGTGDNKTVIDNLKKWGAGVKQDMDPRQRTLFEKVLETRIISFSNSQLAIDQQALDDKQEALLEDRTPGQKYADTNMFGTIDMLDAVPDSLGWAATGRMVTDAVLNAASPSAVLGQNTAEAASATGSVLGGGDVTDFVSDDELGMYYQMFESQAPLRGQVDGLIDERIRVLEQTRMENLTAEEANKLSVDVSQLRAFKSRIAKGRFASISSRADKTFAIQFATSYKQAVSAMYGPRTNSGDAETHLRDMKAMLDSIAPLYDTVEQQMLTEQNRINLTKKTNSTRLGNAVGVLNLASKTTYAGEFRRDSNVDRVSSYETEVPPAPVAQ